MNCGHNHKIVLHRMRAGDVAISPDDLDIVEPAMLPGQEQERHGEQGAQHAVPEGAPHTWCERVIRCEAIANAIGLILLVCTPYLC